MEPLADVFRHAGHNAVVVDDLPTQDKTATAENHAEVLASHLSGLTNAVTVTYSGGSGSTQLALEKLQREQGGHPVKLDVSVSGSLGPLPGVTNPRPRNTQEFRDGLEVLPEPDGRTRFNRAKALDVFFNVSRWIGRLAVPGMIPQYRFKAPPMPKKLLSPIWYLFPRHDKVRDLESVLETAWHYRDDPNKMQVYVTEGDHALPLADPVYLGYLIMNRCARLGIIPPPPPPPRPAASLPMQRRAEHDVAASAMVH